MAKMKDLDMIDRNVTPHLFQMKGQRRWCLVCAGGGCLSRTKNAREFEVVDLDKLLVE
jgi:hypothetical protein